VALLDRALPAGLPRAGTVLLLYDPGSGEAELLSRLVMRCIQRGQATLYLAFDNFPKNIRQLIQGMAGDVDWSSLQFVDCYSKAFGVTTDEAYVEDPENLSGISIAVSSLMSEKSFSLMVLDSLSTLIRRRELRSALEFLRILVARARQAKCLSIVLLNRKGFHPTTIASVQEMVDGIIELRIEESPTDITRLFRIAKMTGAKHLTMWTPYEISDAGEFVPTLGRQKGRNNNLPVRLTSLVGRDTDLTKVKDLFLQKKARIVTLTGPGGAGKTALGLETARGLVDEFSDGVYFVPLERVSDSNLLASTIMRTLGLTERRDLSPILVLRDHLRSNAMLLVLDNFEQIMTAATQLTDLLTACPKLSLLVTSRQPLRIKGEQEFQVSPLALPDLKHLVPASELRNYASVELFVERGRVVRPDFRIRNENALIVGEICVRLDGLPLALELVAPLLKAYTPEQILSQLKENPYILKGTQDLPERQRTLQNTIGWSYQLLSGEEKTLFEILSVFEGGCTIDGVASVCSEELDAHFLDLLTALVDKNLVVREEYAGELRFTMLNTIRVFAISSLADTHKDQETRARHANYFLGLVERARPELLGSQQAKWFERLEVERDNLRASLEWFLKQNDVLDALRIVGGLWRFWYARGHLTEGMRWLLQALTLSTGSTSLRAEALYGAGALSHTQGNYSAAQGFYEQSLGIFRTLSDKRGIAAALNSLGTLANDQGNYSEARRFFEESLAISSEFGDDREKSYLINNLALLAQGRGDYAMAKSLYERSLTIKRRVDDERGIAATVLNLGNVARDLANYDLARSQYEESLMIFKKLGEDRGVAYCLNNLALVATSQGDYHKSRTLLEEGLPIFERLGDQLGFGVYLQTRAELARAQQDYNLASILYKDSLRLRDEIGDKVGSVECLEGLAALASLGGYSEYAVRLYSGAQGYRKSVNVPLPPAEEGDYQANLANARNRMTEKDFSAAWEEGRLMKPNELLELALKWRPKNTY